MGPANDKTHCGYPTAGSSRSTHSAAVSHIRLPIHDGHVPRALHEKGTRSFSPQCRLASARSDQPTSLLNPPSARYQLIVGGMTTEQLAIELAVHRTTVARWVEQARARHHADEGYWMRHGAKRGTELPLRRVRRG